MLADIFFFFYSVGFRSVSILTEYVNVPTTERFVFCLILCLLLNEVSATRKVSRRRRRRAIIHILLARAARESIVFAFRFFAMKLFSTFVALSIRALRFTDVLAFVSHEKTVFFKVRSVQCLPYP